MSEETVAELAEGDFAAVVVAGGRSLRMGFNKLLVPLAGRAVVLHSLLAWWRWPGLRSLVLVVPEGEIEVFTELTATGFAGEVSASGRPDFQVVAGGAERMDSVRAGLVALPLEVAWVAVHDAARPLLTTEMIRRCLARAREVGGAVCAEPCHDTLHRGNSAGLLVETVSREGLWRMQTPQIFRRERLLELILGAKARGETWTDEAGMVLQAGDAVGVVAAEGPNFKITLPPDLALAEAVLASRR